MKPTSLILHLILVLILVGTAAPALAELVDGLLAEGDA